MVVIGSFGICPGFKGLTGLRGLPFAFGAGPPLEMWGQWPLSLVPVT